MDIIFAVTLVLLLFAFVAGLLWGLAMTIDKDGLGHRPPPPSHLA